METLFESFNPVPVIERTETCRSCLNRERWQCNSKVIQYCGVRSSGRTRNKKLKIKCNQIACEFYNNQPLQTYAPQR